MNWIRELPIASRRRNIFTSGSKMEPSTSETGIKVAVSHGTGRVALHNEGGYTRGFHMGNRHGRGTANYGWFRLLLKLEG